MDATNKMLEVLVAGSSAVEAPVVVLSRDEQLRYLQKNASGVPVETRRDLMHVVKLNGFGQMMTETPEGVIVNLAGLPEHVIYTMYEILSHKIDSLRV